MTGIRLQVIGAQLDLADFPGAVVQQVKEPLNASKIDQSLKNLHATGRFTALEADAKTSASGVELVFRGTARFFVGIVTVEGAPRGLHAAILASATGLRLGEPLSPRRLQTAANRVKTLLNQDAYYGAKVRYREARDPATQEANVTFTVSAGKPARLAGVEYLGRAMVPSARLSAIAGWKTGSHVTAARLERGLYRIRQFYMKQDRVEAVAKVERRAYDATANEERLTVRIDVGPKVFVRVEGGRISAADLRRTLSLYREGATDPIVLQEGEQELANYFEGRGYFSAKAHVTSRTEPGTGDVYITYSVVLGKRGEFVGYAFRGNHALTAQDLSRVMRIQPGDTGQGTFDQDLLNRDVAALVNLYRSRGFLDATASPSLNDRYKGQPNHIYVTLNVDEGPQTTVRSLATPGLDSGMLKSIEPLLLLRQGAPYSPQRARADHDSVLAYLLNRGYSRASFDWEASPADANHQVAVTYEVEPGPKQIISRILFLGNTHTRAGIIDRQLSFDEGEPLNESSLVQSRQRLYDLGLFNEVNIAPQDPASPEATKTILVQVEEAKRWTVGYGGGVDIQRLPANQAKGKYGVSPRVSLELTRLNVGGRPQTFTARGHISNLETIGSAAYTIPRFLNRPNLTLRIGGLLDQSRNVLTFNSKTREADLSLQKIYSAHSSILAQYTFRKVSISDLKINPNSIPFFSSERVATFGGSYVNDHRDNPVDATRGSYSTAGVAVAWRGIGSQADFVRLTGQNSTYYRLRPRLIFARNTRIALEPAFGPTLREGIPLAERFYMGGSESHRGFSLNQAGPRDQNTGFPIGGGALFLNQTELRIPFKQGRFGLVLFQDAGNVFSSVGVMRLLKFHQTSPTDFDYDVMAAGAGFRYQTPVGPIRVDVGYAFNPPRFTMKTNNILEVLRLPHTQFFLSVGQSF